MGAIGLNSEGDQCSIRCCIDPKRDGAGKRFRIGDDVISGGKQHQGVRISLRGNKRRDASCRRGISTNGLEHDCARLYANLFELVGDKETVPVICDNAKIDRKDFLKASGKSVETDSRGLLVCETAWGRPREKPAKVSCPRPHTG